jgi:phosphinothricin acetyltransferase
VSPQREHTLMAAEGLVIRDARASDLPRLTAIYNHYVEHTPTTFDTEPFTVDERRAWFDRYAATGRHRLLVAELDDRIAGYVSTSPFHTRKAYETTVELTVLCAPEFVGRRIGRAMYARLFDDISREDIHAAVAAITMPNEGSVALHEEFGFKRTALLEEVGRKFGRYWDVLWMSRAL